MVSVRKSSMMMMGLMNEKQNDLLFHMNIN